MTGESYVDLVSGGPIQTVVHGINVQSSATTITLAFPADRIQKITMTAGSLKLRLPAASNYSDGQDFVVVNAGLNAFTIWTNDGTTQNIGTAAIGSSYYVYLVSRSSEADTEGTWGFNAFGGGGASTGANSDITSLSGLTTPLSVGQGGTGLDADITGGTSQYVKQATLGGAFTVGAIAVADYATYVGDSGSGGTKGAVPAPAAGDAAAQKYLAAGGGWSTPSGSGASASEPYVTIGNTAGLSAERALTAGSGITMVDGGANSTVTLSVTVALPATAGNGSSMPRVNVAETAIEYRTPGQVRTDLSLGALALLDTVATAQIDNNAVTLGKMATGTQGGTLYYGASGVIAQLAAGTSGQLLKTQGASANPTWAWSGLVQRAYATYVTYTAISTVIPYDDSIPQNGEGDEVLTVSITPKSATNRLRIRAVVFVGNGTAGASYATLALFQDSTANALSANSTTLHNLNYTATVVLEYEMDSGTTSATTFKLRVGPNTGTVKLNGDNSARLYGGVARSTLIIEEIVA
jgi:hypothetical protein